MTVDLFFVLRFEDKNDLDGDEVVGVVAVRENQRRGSVDGELGSVLEDMCYSVLVIDFLFHDTILVDTNRSENIKYRLVHSLETVDNQRHRDALPSSDTFLSGTLPISGRLGLADITNVQHDSMEGTSIKDLVFLVGRDSDEKLGGAGIKGRAKRPTILASVVVGVARRSRVAHVSKLCAIYCICPFCFNSVFDGSRDRVLGNKITACELNLASDTALDSLPTTPRCFCVGRSEGRPARVGTVKGQVSLVFAKGYAKWLRKKSGRR